MMCRATIEQIEKNNPSMKIIQATHTTELAVGFGRKVKNLLERDEYLEIFPDAKLAVDSKASGRWDTARGGMYYAVGVGSNLAGRGADLCIIDFVIRTFIVLILLSVHSLCYYLYTVYFYYPHLH